MNLAEQVGALVVVICTVAGLWLQVHSWIDRQRDRELKAFLRDQRKTRREGYERRNEEIRPVIDRVVGLLDGVYGALHDPAEVRRRIDRAISELSDAWEGEPDDDADRS